MSTFVLAALNTRNSLLASFEECNSEVYESHLYMDFGYLMWTYSGYDTDVPVIMVISM